MRRSTTIQVALAFAVGLAVPSAGQDAASFYEENCATCHTIGQGPQGGPDLKSVTARRDREWLIRFLLDPEAFAADPTVAQMIKDADGLTMAATEGLTREMADAILRLIDQRSGRDTATAKPADRPFTPEDVERGRAMFAGRARLSGRGPACGGCHDSAVVPEPGGGRLGPDLTNVYARLGGRPGLTAWLGATPTPMMRAVYRARPLSADESLALAAFFDDSNTHAPAAASRGRAVVAAGVTAALAIAAVVGLTGARRFRAVRRPLVARMRGGSQ
jgi:cytochrome c2